MLFFTIEVSSYLREDVMQALSMREAHELEDEIDEAAEDARSAQEKRAKEAAKLRRSPKPLDDGGGMCALGRRLTRAC